MGHNDVIKELLMRFPAIQEDLTDKGWSGLLHLEIACFARYTQRQIDKGDRKELQSCFELAHKFLHEGNSDVKNAIHVSYLENLNFKDGKTQRAWAMKEMSSLLKTGHNNIMNYLKDMTKSPTGET